MSASHEQEKQRRIAVLLVLAVLGIAIASGLLAISLPLDQTVPGRMVVETEAFIMLFLFGTAAFAVGYHFRFRR